ncbi:TetR/AcrR family transcriptional regulator [Demequina sp. B12]|uniref:TetR/AcrR family transcriptional regulator n=1 Tax=Demequina sp. B12 TaxID=2992757 RepID=UPI00237AE346|nr:TetR/AcrR family transcriptional regulator [Demequina sp. B12]MDE0573480.1 TetR/AcrR family transcriptional regulator [Demequina sp. B12]
MTKELPHDTLTRILEACRHIVLTEGAAAVSTRKVAAAAQVPLSQIHYHCGSKRGLMLAMFAAENDRLVTRQAAMFAGNEPFDVQWRKACDYLDEDLESGYVRVLQEMITAGYSDAELRTQVRTMLDRWAELIRQALSHHYERGLPLGPLSPAHVTALICAVFLGAETMLLMGQEGAATPIREALRALEPLIAQAHAAAYVEF